MSRRRSKLVTTIAWGVLAYALLSSRACRPPAPTPPADAPDLLPAFEQSDSPLAARQDALAFAQLCRSIAKAIRYDDSRPEPRLTTGRQLDRLRRYAREYAYNGRSLATKYPLLPDKLRAYFDRALGTDSGPVDSAKRKKWADAFDAVAAASQYAASQL